MKAFAVELSEEAVAEIRELYNLKTDAEVRERLQYWVDLAIDKTIIKTVEAKDE